MENAIKIIFIIGAILLWFYPRIRRRSGKKRESDRQNYKSQDVVEHPDVLLPQWDEKHRKEVTEEEARPATSSLEEPKKSSLPSETQLAQDEKNKKVEKPKEKKATPVTIAGMPLTPENIRHGIIFSEILKRRGQDFKN